MDCYRTEKITDRIYLVVETYGPHSHVISLLLGDEKAAVIDTGMGATGNLRKVVETITPLPLICLITHLHPDHAGAAALFDTCYMNEADAPLLSWAITKEKRMADLQDVFEAEPELRQQVEKEIVDDADFTYESMSDGNVFDLGGVTLEVFAAPGHTEGSVVLYCKEENVLFTGDAIAPKTIVFGERQTTYTPLKTVYEQLLKITKRIDEKTMLFCGHVPRALSASVAGDLLKACKNVLSGNPSREVPRLPRAVMQQEEGRTCYQETVNGVQLVYDTASL